MLGSRLGEGSSLRWDKVLGWPLEDRGVGGAGLGVIFASDVEGEVEERVGLGGKKGREAKRRCFSCCLRVWRGKSGVRDDVCSVFGVGQLPV